MWEWLCSMLFSSRRGEACVQMPLLSSPLVVTGRQHRAIPRCPLHKLQYHRVVAVGQRVVEHRVGIRRRGEAPL